MKTSLFVWLAIVAMVPGLAVADDAERTIEVRATSEVVVPTDTVVLPLNVMTHATEAQKAKRDNDQIAKKIFELAESQGIAPPRLLNTELRFEFDREPKSKDGFREKESGDDDDDKATGPVVRMQRELEVRFEKLAQAVRFVDELAKSDSVRKSRELRLSPLRFDVSDSKTPSLEARRRAVKLARERAVVLAEQAGLKLGDAIRIVDDETHGAAAGRATALDDPFGASSVDRRERGEAIPVDNAGQLVSFQKGAADERSLDSLPPSHRSFIATVRIVYAAEKP